MQKRKRIFDDDSSPIRQLQKYCYYSNEEEMKQTFQNMIDERKNKIQSIQIEFTKDQIDKFREHSLNQLNRVAQNSFKQIQQIKIPESQTNKLEGLAKDYQTKIEQKQNTFNQQLDNVKKQLQNKVDPQVIDSQLASKQFQFATATITKLTHQEFVQDCRGEISNFERTLTSQMSKYQEQLNPEPQSDLQALNSLLDSVNGYEDIECNILELEKKMNEFSKSLVV
ncbi:hypothetical protein pb186bvf_002727 [Paramecium bursaria]